MSLQRFKKRKTPEEWLSADDANALDADTVASALGLSIEHQGKHCELSNGVRGTDRDGRMVWCAKDATGIGDNCALAQYVSGLDFRGALRLLVGDSAPLPVVPASPKARVLTLPYSSPSARATGREYLFGRGVSADVLDAAEACGMLLYAPGAVLFVGRAGTVPKSATRRGYLPEDIDPKRDLSGSDKAFPAILPGDVSEVWIVEGGTDALALQTMHQRRPTVIVSGGSRVRHWIPQPHIQSLLKRAWTVVIACENERTADIQAKTDAEHMEQAKLIEPACNNVRFWRPPDGVKDLADLAIRNHPTIQLQALLRTS